LLDACDDLSLVPGVKSYYVVHNLALAIDPKRGRVGPDEILVASNLSSVQRDWVLELLLFNIIRDTIIFFSSDNGAEDYRIANAANAGVGNTGPLRARKRSMYEGGIRTFGLLRWPGHVAAGRRDETSVIGAVDFLPTICKLAGAPVPAGVQSDGEDVSDIWLGQSRPRTRPLHWEWLFNVTGGIEGGYMPPMLAVRDGNWKLFVDHHGAGAQLYHIPEDVGEEHDVAAENPAVVKSLTAKALEWVKTLPASAARDRVLQTGQPQGSGNRPKAAKKAAKANTKATPSDRAAIFKRWDTNRNGQLSLDEYKAGLRNTLNVEQRFRNFDANHDGMLTEEEFVNQRASGT
jgi:N-acetylgalactosamine-6-sulfatase